MTFNTSFLVASSCMKALVSSLETKIVETEKKYEETNKLSEERLKQAMEAESMIVKLKTNMHRLVVFVFDLLCFS